MTSTTTTVDKHSLKRTLKLFSTLLSTLQLTKSSTAKKRSGMLCEWEKDLLFLKLLTCAHFFKMSEWSSQRRVEWGNDGWTGFFGTELEWAILFRFFTQRKTANTAWDRTQKLFFHTVAKAPLWMQMRGDEECLSVWWGRGESFCLSICFIVFELWMA